MAREQRYGAEQIKILEGLQAVRRRPGMYIGTTSKRGLHHLAQEIVDNSIDEAMNGFCDRIVVELGTDGSIAIEDNGGGIPVELHSTGVPAVQLVFTQLHAGGKFEVGTGRYQFSGGLHGVGASVVTALSEWLTVEVYREGKVYRQEYREGGQVIGPLEVVGKTTRHGTRVEFKPDPTVFEEPQFDFDYLSQRLQELAFLNSGLAIEIRDAATGEERKYQYDGGLRAFVRHLNENKDALHRDVIYLEGNRDGIGVELAIQYTQGYTEGVFSYVNNINTVEGGMHESGFKAGLTRAFNDFARDKRLLKAGEENLAGEDIREGITAVISLRVPDPQFEGQTKTKLGTSAARGVTEAVTHEGLIAYLQDNYRTGKSVVEKALQSARARKAARKARELTRKKNGVESTILTAKLADCASRDADETEIFLVEGDSAGGTAKQGRDRCFQAILPLRGKILNVEKSRLDRILRNNEIQLIIAALEAGIGEDIDTEKLRYGRVIIMTDADVDGSHIRTLLLTFFYRYMRPLIEQGRVFAAQPPLYKVNLKRGGPRYFYAERELAAAGYSGSGDKVQRFKGLGEMNPDELWNTTMNPKTRTLVRISIEDAAAAEAAFTVLMGSKVKPRREFIERNALKASTIHV